MEVAYDPFRTSADFTAHIECVVGVTVDVAAAFEFANVNHEIHLSRRAREPEGRLMTAFGQLFKGSKQALTKPGLLSDRAF